MPDPIIQHFADGFYVVDITLRDGRWVAWMTNDVVEVFVPIPGDPQNAAHAACAPGGVVAEEQVRRGANLQKVADGMIVRPELRD
ncbi:hypothetical protein [Bradyrhizobium sp. Leo170]|uniref:hypothetical protein n=1 Tax=Bradyrhizobium sp. Leo170 TaxID=1571199 RepID=UPI00102E8747|nr:hypothetical protein [Bradyrhizobium sp. Leo170]TAI60089.1 hypothetical protein CWO89_42635 [Bradyrhizobium sp. Leo170]